jgi:hypothetical protein
VDVSRFVPPGAVDTTNGMPLIIDGPPAEQAVFLEIVIQTIAAKPALEGVAEVALAETEVVAKAVCYLINA